MELHDSVTSYFTKLMLIKRRNRFKVRSICISNINLKKKVIIYNLNLLLVILVLRKSINKNSSDKLQEKIMV